MRSDSLKIDRHLKKINQFKEEKLDPARTIVVQDIKVERPSTSK